jgi:hypothetical protein
MTASVQAFFLHNPKGPSGSGLAWPEGPGGMFPETPPCIIWGQGTPAAIEPFTLVGEGSIYIQSNATDDEAHVYQKVANDGDANDYVALLSAINVFAPVLTTSDSIQSIKIAGTPTGSAATWYSPLFVQLNIGNAVTGYSAAAEFEANASNTNSAKWFVLSLNANGTDTNRHGDSAYIALFDYGTAAKRMRNLFDFESLGTVPATASTTAIVSKLAGGKETTCDAAVKFRVGGVSYWFLATTTAPA